MVMNIVNQLVLFVDPRKKESDRRRQRLRFELQLKDVGEVKSAIFAMQVSFSWRKLSNLLCRTYPVFNFFYFLFIIRGK